MRSPLDFGNSEDFRQRLLKRNLIPYKKSPLSKTPPFSYEITPLRDSSVKDSPDKYIDDIIFAKDAYKLNQYGKQGGYLRVKDPGLLNNKKSNYGEYSIKNSVALSINRPELDKNLSKNYYTTKDNLKDSAIFIEQDENWFDPNLPKKGILYYWGEGANSFIPSTYSPYGILINNAETKANLAADSFITRLSAEKLNSILEERSNTFLSKIDTIQKFNKVISNIDDPLDVYNLITGRYPIIQPNWSITRPNNLIVAGGQFFIDLIGGELPFPNIVGSYFDESISLNGKQKKGLLGGKFQQKKTGSQLFYDNMGEGQRLVLYNNVNQNLYKPNYDRTGLVGSFLDLFTKNKSSYYIGSENLDISDIVSPVDDLPNDQFGRSIKSIVYGPTEVSKVYEGEDFNPPTGLNGVNYIDGGGIEGGLTWVSPKYKNNSGKNAGKGGEIFGDNGSKQSTFDSTESTNYTFKEGSILDDTQRIINSQPNGANRLKHVGNAMDQVSKVFNDGYKEITKGSRVKAYKYQDSTNLVGGSFQEYCRLFTKDSPYMTYDRLQKSNGITTEGRRMKSSVINKTYDLSISPKKGVSSNDAKKYMLSLENLAWRTTNMYLDLPECEKGPNGGRLMWFPPYDLKVSDSSVANWNSNDFLGRPEPVHTYKNTSRTGSIEFSIVVDHPSILNVITNRVLEKESNSEKINGILSSFFAGCLKYDIYELAKIYNTMKLSELEELQAMVKEVTSVKDQVSYIKRTVITGKDPGTPAEVETPNDGTDNRFEKYKEYAFYFDNDVPKTTTTNYGELFGSYTGSSIYTTSESKNFMNLYVIDNFTYLNDFINESNKFLKDNDGSTLTITLSSSASKPASDDYNKKLSERRGNSVESYLKDKIKSDKFKIIKNTLGETTGVVAKSNTPNTSNIVVPNCSEFGGNLITSVSAMACRRVAIKDVKAVRKVVAPKNEVIEPSITTSESEIKINKQIIERKLINSQEIIYKNVSKKVIQKLLSECDYFDTISETDSFLYNNIKEKLKYFTPAFHSTTPEGLNGRLTFLQQCVRPGDTIPTIRKDGVGEVRDAKNTAFGIPPVLILRVGDFFHTKIIPENLTISYDPLHWDMNPEGIGFQPMIAKVTLSFKFVGASGLSGAVDRLQNALSFNYYANTEVYDARADKTDNSLDNMDKKIEDFIREKEKKQEDDNNNNNNNNVVIIPNNNTIGVIDETNKKLDYYNLMVELVSAANTYISLINDKVQNISNKNGSAILFFLFENMKNTDGVYSTAPNSEFKLFGTPSLAYKDKLFEYIREFQKNIKNGNDDFIKNIDKEFKGSKTKEVDVVKLNYDKYTNKVILQLIKNIDGYLNDFINIQLTFHKVLSKVLVVLSKYSSKYGYDGFIDSSGIAKIYELTSYQVLIENVLKGVNEIIKNNILYYLNNKVNPNKILKGDEQYSFLYLLMYNSIMDNDVNNEFKNAIKISSNLSYKPNIDESNTKIFKIFDEYIKDVKDRFSDKNKEYNDGLAEFGLASKKALKSLKTEITLNKTNFIADYIEVLTPDNNMGTIFRNLNTGLNYDNDNTTWSINRDDFIITKNKLKI